MKKVNKSLFLPIMILFLLVSTQAFAQILPRLGQSRSGTSGFQFLKINVDPRTAAMGNSGIATITDGAAAYWNPALAVQSDQSEFFASYTSYFVDIDMSFITYMHRFGAFSVGGALQFLDSGDIDETTEFQPLGTGRTFSTTHMALSLIGSQKITDFFSYGITLKYLDERIEEVQFQTGAIDFGFFYKVGDTGLRFAVGINNFGFDANGSGTTRRTALPSAENPDGIIEETKFEELETPTVFSLGAAYDAYSNESIRVNVNAQITNPSDNAERVSIGSELTVFERFFLRGGFQFGVDESDLPSFGAGVKSTIMGGKTLGADYSFSTFDRLGTVHRIAIKIGI